MKTADGRDGLLAAFAPNHCRTAQVDGSFVEVHICSSARAAGSYRISKARAAAAGRSLSQRWSKFVSVNGYNWLRLQKVASSAPSIRATK